MLGLKTSVVPIDSEQYPQKAKRLLNDPSIHKMFVNDQTFTMQVSAPHEGFQADFLYGAKASNYDGKNNILE